MMWGKLRPIKDGDTRLRCQHKVRRGLDHPKCGRLARPYLVSKAAHQFGRFDLCEGHASGFRDDGFTVERIDRRRRAA